MDRFQQRQARRSAASARARGKTGQWVARGDVLGGDWAWVGVALREDLPGAGRRCFRERARQPRGDLAVEGGGWVDGGFL